MVVHYLRAAARKATSGKTVTLFLGGAGRPEFEHMVVGYLRGPWPLARPPGIKNPSVKSYSSLASGRSFRERPRQTGGLGFVGQHRLINGARNLCTNARTSF